MLFQSDIKGLMTTIEKYIAELPLKKEQKDLCLKVIQQKLQDKLAAVSQGGNEADECNSTAEGICAHAEGCSTTASGDCSHSEGLNTAATGEASHAEGCFTEASVNCSHAEGILATANGSLATHAEGIATTADGNLGSHAEGIGTRADGPICAHAEGIVTTAIGVGAHAEGINTQASRDGSHAEGDTTVASGDTAHAEGDGTTASGFASHAEGNNTTASADSSHAEGRSTTARESASHAEGSNTTASGVGSHAEGALTEAGIDTAHAEGYSTRAFGIGAHAEGMETFANQFSSHAEGANTEVNAFASHAEGSYTLTEREGAHIMGRFGTACENYAWHMAGGDNEDDRTVTAIIRNNGNACFQSVSTCPSCPEYAEMYETHDGKSLAAGYFVTLEGDKIKKATTGDEFLLGVTSAAPAILGGTAELYWKNKYLKDEWGSIQLTEVTVPARKDREGRVISPEHTEMQKVINPEFNRAREYVPRTRRAEWIPVCLLGQVLVRDDGSCQANGYCRVGEEGTATVSSSGYRVLKRTGDKQIKILFK